MAMAFSSVADVRALVPDHVFKRSKEIVSSHKLLSVRFHDPLLQKASATCSGSNPGDSYSLSFSINAESPNKPICECSCPAALKAKGSFCKHVISLLLLRIEELAKLSKKRENELILSEFKQMEDRLGEDKLRECSTVDSQATEPLPSNEMGADMAEEDTAATATTEFPTIKNNGKRILPSWISKGCSSGVKNEAKGKVARKTSSTRKAIMKESDADGHGDKEESCTQSSGKTLDGKASKREPRLQKRKRTDAKSGYGDGELVDESEERDPRKNTSQSRKAARGQRRVQQAAEKRTRPSTSKMRKVRGLVESDLSEEGECKKNTGSTPDIKDELDLTPEDLVKFAKEHLEMEKESGQNVQQPDAIAEKGNAHLEVSLPKTEESMFSVKGWNQKATRSAPGKDSSFHPRASGLWKSNSHIGGEEPHHVDSMSASVGEVVGGKTDLKPVENVVDDMLGLFFGPSLSKVASSKSARGGALEDDFSVPHTASFPSFDPSSSTVLPAKVDSAQMPKKKGSLRDKVMMYLGDGNHGEALS